MAKEKIHGCCVKERVNTIWCNQQLTADPTIRARIERYKTWLLASLPNKDLLIIGFWTDWKYLNDVLNENKRKRAEKKKHKTKIANDNLTKRPTRAGAK